VNVFFAGIAAIGAALLLKHQPASKRSRLDLPGVALVSASVGMITVSASLSNIVAMPRLGPKPVVATGLLLAAVSMVLLTRIGPHSGYAAVVRGPLLVAGLGFGFTIAPAMSTGTLGVAPQDAGVASAVLNAGQQIGGSIGTSLLNTLAASATVSYLTTHVTAGAMVHGQPGPQLAGRTSWWPGRRSRGRCAPTWPASTCP
jgi:hypothetical protein